MDSSPSVSVVICAHSLDRWDEIQSAVASLRTQTLAPEQKILVIDYNDELFQRSVQQFSDVLVLENAQPKGLSGARNTGLQIATGDIVAFLDDDASAEPRWLETLAASYQDPTVAGAGSRIIAKWPSTRPRWFPVEFDWVIGCSYRGLPESTSRVRNFIGAGMSYRRDVLSKVGQFNLDLGRIGFLPVGCEETELGIRIGEMFPSSVLLHVPESRVLHSVTPVRTTFSYFIQRCYFEGFSKSRMAKLTGTSTGLSAERTYSTKVLPQGVLYGLRDAFHGDWSGILRAGAIAIGFLTTVVGYLRASVGSTSPWHKYKIRHDA